MTRHQAIRFMKLNPGVYLKLDWWTDNMAIKYDDKKNIFVSGPGVQIDIRFLLSGNYVLSPYKQDIELGGLFAL
jgi:hypothetical protein